MFIYDMQYSDRNSICQILDSGDQMWKNLAGEIGLKTLEVSLLEHEYLRKNGSPTDRLLNKWGHSNATVDMLAYKLISIRALRALEVIRHLVSREVLISIEEDVSPSQASTDQCFSQIKNPANSDENLPIPSQISDTKGMLSLETNKSDDSSNCRSLDIKDSRMKRVSFFPFVKVALATKNFCEQSILGKGKFSTTYKGLINQSSVAIKVLVKKENMFFSRTFCDDIDLLTKELHQNVVCLIAISQDGPNFCFVYEYLENGSLRDKLQCKDGSPPLAWTQRHSILKDASRGLMHLHGMTPTPFIHKNIKSSNVLFGINFSAKLGDFGFICEPGGNGVNSQQIQVTHTEHSNLTDRLAYMPRDFFRYNNQHSPQTDIYAFGLVILETCTGKDATEWFEMKGKSLAEWAHEQFSKYEKSASQLISLLKDPNVIDWDNRLWLTVAMMGKLCTDERQNNRPGIEKVYDTIDKYYNDIINSEVSSKMQTTCIRKPTNDKLMSDIYSPSSEHINSACQSGPGDLMASSNFVSIDEDIDKMKAKKTFSGLCFDPALFDEMDVCPLGKHFLKSEISFPCSGSNDRGYDDNCNNQLEIVYSSKESVSKNEVSGCQVGVNSSSSDVDSFMKKLDIQELERSVKLEHLKKEVPDEF